ncbi:dUTP diphosphatase [Fictibacillus terranigra]|uniref:dUTP diphosphatase n=1 Tax=Fictibacillus terranigra TaxID=3058424 RepID=A0ABT8E428_9BACL|nr:dUTP diphosphatase [Fictibacillus sp. CENA-BCM004]MDN4072659.1 dUTP diphosphatase [Fictibacillus sp. CENA-BCM004]
MGFKELFEMQNQLNERIVQEHALHNEDLYDKRLLALLVELGELANETRCFKYWSVKPPSSDSVILEEYVDGLHFVLSVGLDHGLQDAIKEGTVVSEDLTSQFLCLYRTISELQCKKDTQLFSRLFSEYLGLGHLLGFTEETIFKGYYSKNQVNHQRQDEGY